MDYVGKAVVYKIINLANAKFYVGSTVKVKERFRTHRRQLRAGKHHCPHLQSAWSKYGEDSFVFKVVAVIEDPALLHIAEQKLLDEHHGTENCYNFAKYTDNSNRGIAQTETHRKRISEAIKRHYESNPHPRQGVRHTEESKKLMRANRAGKPMSEETKVKLRQANLGKVYSEETRAKLSSIRKGLERKPEHAAKYNKPIVEVTSGQIFPSLKVVKEVFGMSAGMLAKALAADRPLTRGNNAGKHFRYANATGSTNVEG